MQLPSVVATPSNVPEFLQGGGELGQQIREYDWSKTSLGPVETWPQSLRTCIRIMLTSRQPIWIGWGKELIKFYNDPYKAIVGGKHPWALGKPASVVWKDIWKDIEPMLRQVMEKDEGTYVESQLLIMERNGYPEETYYTFSYTPIPGDDGKTAGMFCANTDDTDRITSERQLKTLTELGKRLADCKSNHEIIEKTITTLRENPQDFPFAIFRTITDNKAIFTHSTPLDEASALIAKEYEINADSDVAEIIRKTINTRKPHVYKNLLQKVGELPKGAWEISPDQLIVLPIMGTTVKEPYGILSVGLNPYRLPDEKYMSFFMLVADQIATSFVDVHVLEEERKRAEALAEIDRAKTTFFSNISHEFRTPLTLLLGPIEDALNDPATVQENKMRMDVAYRNALRMQKLVNTLLDFSRIEAGRTEGKFSRVDICAFTQELAGTFRSAIEKAGMQLVFDCDKIKNEVYVDIDMWEKIVLNLISNAFKYSNEGNITVQLKEVGNTVQLSVSDTGIGIPADQIDKIFDRFHRVENIQGRSQEGTGIGLAMVKELVRMHQGTISVKSQVGKGSAFIVTIPSGRKHLEDDKLVDGSIALSHYANAFVQEAMKWNQKEKYHESISDLETEAITNQTGTKKYKVLLADDNADIRDYVSRLLSGHFEVMTAIDGEDAFNKLIHKTPDLLLSDIMMPSLDGFGLLNRIRNHPDHKNLPVILLSARAGEEAKVEGLDAGADDYLVKPFSAKELLARVEANIKISKNRAAAEANLRGMIRQLPIATVLLKGPSLLIEIVNEKGLELWGRKYEEVINRPIAEALPELGEQGFIKLLEQVYTTGTTFNGNEVPVQLFHSDKPEIFYLNFIYQPLKNEHGETEGIIGAAIDVTETVLARKKVEQSQKELNELANAVPQLVWVAEPDGKVIYYNDRLREFSGAQKNADGSWHWNGLVHADDLGATEAAWKQAVANGDVYQTEHRIQVKNGEYRWFLSRAYPHKNDQGIIIKWFGTATDIHSSKTAATILEEEVKKRTRELNELNHSLIQSNNELQQFAHVASHDLKEPVRKIKIFTSRLIEDGKSSFSENGKLYLQKITSASDRMNTMIEGVLNYSMLSAMNQKIEQVDLNEILKNIEIDLEVLITQKEASINYKNLPTIEGASVLLYQLFYNLVNNSLKFSKPGVLPVIIITSVLEQQGEEELVKITVRDNGIGFEQEFQEKIFETFLRLNSKDQFEGTGLGLSLCKRIVERHGGSIQAFGAPDEGSSFVIYLPLTQPKINN
jgi:PAS domain S-box-containing protein